MAPPKFLMSFNLPDLKLPTGRRDVTNDPAQALAMLNHPLVLQLSEHWAKRLIAEGHADKQTRIRAMFAEALAREPTPEEVRRWSAAVTSFNTSGSLMADQAAWSDLAHAMFNTKEFIYVR